MKTGSTRGHSWNFTLIHLFLSCLGVNSRCVIFSLHRCTCGFMFYIYLLTSRHHVAINCLDWTLPQARRTKASSSHLRLHIVSGVSVQCQHTRCDRSIGPHVHCVWPIERFKNDTRLKITRCPLWLKASGLVRLFFQTFYKQLYKRLIKKKKESIDGWN